MATPTKATANTDSTANQATIQSDADQIFIDDANLAIAMAIELGHFEVTLQVQEPCSLQALHDYFAALNYAVSYPGLGMGKGQPPYQPAQLFGYFWEQYWAGMNVPAVSLPARMTICWR